MMAVLTKNEIVLLIVGGLFRDRDALGDHPARGVQADQGDDRYRQAGVRDGADPPPTTRRRAGTNPRSSCGSGWSPLLFALLALGTLKLAMRLRRGLKMTVPDLSGKTVVVVGLALTGVAVARFCHRRGARVVVNRRQARRQARRADLRTRRRAGDLGARRPRRADPHNRRSGRHVARRARPCPRCAPRAPSASRSSPRSRLAYRFLDPGATLLAITGTNVKSTTTRR